MATTVYIDGVQGPLSAGQTTQVGGTQGPNATHNSTGAAGEFIGANFNYIKITTPDLNAARGVDANGELQALPRMIQTIQERASTVVVNQSTTTTSVIVEGPHGWTQSDLQTAIQALAVVDGVSLAGATVTVADALTLA